MNSRSAARASPGSEIRRIGLLLACMAASCCSGGSSVAPVAAAPVITYNGLTDWLVRGVLGGPYTNTSLVLVLENPGSETVEWSASSVPSFLALDQLSGSIPPNAAADVNAGLIQQVADSLGPGQSSGTLAFHNLSSAQADLEIACNLWVDIPLPASELLPETDFVCSGPVLGPFEPAAAVYTLHNSGNNNLHWQGLGGAPWVSVSPAGGVLAPGSSVDLSVAIQAAATGGLASGLNESSVEVNDLSTGSNLFTRGVSLTLGGNSDNGWTKFTPSKDTRQIYVSSSGDDSNDGTSPAHPKRTLAAGRALLRDGFPDWLLLKKGDVFNESLNNWSLSGRSLTERMLLSSYGTGARPLIQSGNVTAMYTEGGTSPSHVAIVGLHFVANAYTGDGTPTGIAWFGHSQNLLIEDCCIEHFHVNVLVQGDPGPQRTANVAIRRNVIADAFNTGTAHAQGLFLSDIDGLLLEENVIDHNGWVDSIQGSLPTIFRHNVYIQNGCTAVSFKGNIVAGTDGAQIRCGGTITDNLVLRCILGLQVGVGNQPESGGISANISGNVILEGHGLDSTHQGIFGIRISNVKAGRIDGNLIANASSFTDARAFWFSVIDGYNGPIAKDLTLSNNICHNAGMLLLEGNEGQYDNLLFERNAIQNAAQAGLLVHMASAGIAAPKRVKSSKNTWWTAGRPSSDWVRLGTVPESLERLLTQIDDSGSSAALVAYPDPRRSAGTYNGTLGGSATYEAFMSECRKQSHDFWRPQYTAAAANAYIGAGFHLQHTATPGDGHHEKH